MTGKLEEILPWFPQHVVLRKWKWASHSFGKQLLLGSISSRISPQWPHRPQACKLTLTHWHLPHTSALWSVSSLLHSNKYPWGASGTAKSVSSLLCSSANLSGCFFFAVTGDSGNRLWFTTSNMCQLGALSTCPSSSAPGNGELPLPTFTSWLNRIATPSADRLAHWQ